MPYAVHFAYGDSFRKEGEPQGPLSDILLGSEGGEGSQSSVLHIEPPPGKNTTKTIPVQRTQGFTEDDFLSDDGCEGSEPDEESPFRGSPDILDEDHSDDGSYGSHD